MKVSRSRSGAALWIPEIQGIRGISILGVMLFHAKLGIEGGFTGVDVFFVISGFVITRLLLAEIQEERFSFLSFYERRIRRILPALFVVLVTVMATMACVARPAIFKSVGGIVAGQVLGLGNLSVWRTTGYFSESAEEQPLLHMWSLAVEEQFYLLLPLLLWMVFRLRKHTFRLSAFVILSAFFAISLLLNLLFIASRPSAVFFLLPTRAWEMLAGCLVACIGERSTLLSPATRRTCLWAGAVCVILGFVMFGQKAPFPGWRAMIPVAGSVAMLVGLQGEGDCVLRRVLRSRFCLLTGDMSYSLYLWHWPLLSVPAMLFPWPLTVLQRLTALGIAVVCSYASIRCVENPIRFRQSMKSRRVLFYSAFIMGSILLSVGLGAYLSNGVPQRFRRGMMAELAQSDAENSSGIQSSNAALLQAGVRQWIGADGPDVENWGVVWGDSHALAAVPAFATVLRERNARAFVAAHPATAPVVGWYHVDRRHGLSEASVEFGEEVLRILKSDKVQNVAIVACWSYYDCDEMRTALLRTVRECRSAGANTWVLSQVPFHPHSVPKVLWYTSLFGSDEQNYAAVADSWNGIAGSDNSFLTELEVAGATVVDIRSAFLREDRKTYRMSIRGRPCYSDTNHLSSYGADAIVAPILRRRLFATVPD